MAGRPVDACPFARPFPDEFAGCPAYHRQEFVALDMQYRFLRVLNTCRHLEARSLPDRLAGFYGACELGAPEERRAWVRQVQERRLDGIRAVGRDLAAATAALTQEMWAAKGDQLRALRAGEPVEHHSARLARVVRDYERRAATFLRRRRPELRALDLPEEACVELIHEVLVDFVQARSLENVGRMPPALLERFPPAARTLLSPNG